MARLLGGIVSALEATYGYEWRQVRARVLKDAQVCAICGGLLDFDAPARSPRSASVDHIFPVRAMRGMDRETRRRMLLDPQLLRPAHYGCNASRQDGRRERPRQHTSRKWAPDGI